MDLKLSAALLILGGVIWFGLLRRTPEQTALATILNKGMIPSGTYVQQPVEVNRSFRTPREIPIAESYAFELRLDGVAEPVRAAFNTVKGRHFEVGQKVRVRYLLRGLPPIWQRITVVDMTPLDTPSP